MEKGLEKNMTCDGAKIEPTGDYLGDIFTNTAEIDIKTRARIYDVLNTFKPEYINLIPLPCNDVSLLNPVFEDGVIRLLSNNKEAFTFTSSDEIVGIYIRQLTVGKRTTISIDFHHGETRMLFAFPTEKIIVGNLK